jgi:hypothetical protein
MPTILLMGGDFSFIQMKAMNPFTYIVKKWKGCKYWLDRELYELGEAFAYNMNNKDKRAVKEIIYNHFSLIEKEWDNFKERNK